MWRKGNTFFSHPCQNWFLFVFFVVVILAGIRWNVNMVLICISFLARDVEHFFMWFLVISSSSFEKPLFSSFAHFFSWSLIFLGVWNFWATYIFWLLFPCQMNSWQRFSPILWAASSVWWPLILLCRRLLVSCRHICQSFLLVAEQIELYLRSHYLCLLIPLYSLLFPALDTGLILRVLIHFELIFVQSESHGFSFSFFCMQISSFPSNICWRDCLFFLV
jgi:hypothetical protein